MDARLFRLTALANALLACGAITSQAASYPAGGSYSSPNFVVTASTAEFAKEVALTAERFREQLAREWLGHTLPRWYSRCKVSVTVGQIGAGGATTFTFAAGEVFGWNMKVQGTPERILDSVIPHEVSHTVFASYFRRPLQRWADEGAASLVEHESERHRQQLLLHQVFSTPQRIPLTRLISMKDYPADMASVLTLYAEGYSLAEYLVQSGGETGKARFLRFLKDANDHDWNYAIRANYGLPDVGSLEQRWTNWVLAGSPDIEPARTAMIAQADAKEARKKGIVTRGQSPDEPSPAPSRQSTRSVSTTTKRTPRNGDLQDPETIDRRDQRVPDDDQTSADRSGNSQIEARRRAGRERMIRDGWEPLPSTGRLADDETGRTRKSPDEATTDDVSPVRRRFRDAARRHEVATSVRPEQEEDPFDDSRLTSHEHDMDGAQTPFQMER